MKKLMAFLLIFAMALTLVSCNISVNISQENGPAEDTEENEAAEVTEDIIPVNVGERVNLMPYGSMMVSEEPVEIKEVSAEEIQEMDRAMRDYIGSTLKSLLINNAKSYYYYDQMTERQRKIYDALQIVVEEPTACIDDGSISVVELDAPYTDDAVMIDFITAYYAMLYDHPEYFWLYNDISTSLLYVTNAADPNVMYFGLSKPYEAYQEELKQFNDAVDAFLADIDTTGTGIEVAHRIHDKLIHMCTYDQECFEGTTLDVKFYNYAHTAYGALVSNSFGAANTCVCDGYSQAFTYLCQQVGLEATTIIGIGESLYDGEVVSGGGHAWGMVKCDDQWYELDSTWDDSMTDLGPEELGFTTSDEYYPYIKAALEDQTYMESISHYLFLVDSPTMAHYIPGDELVYKDQYIRLDLGVAFESAHTRANQGNGFGHLEQLMGLAPFAEY